MIEFVGNAEYGRCCYRFARWVKGVDIEVLQEVVVRGGDEYYINKFRKLT